MNWISVPDTVRAFLANGEWASIDDIHDHIWPKITVNQAVRVFRYYHKGEIEDLDEAIRYGKRRAINVCVRQLTRDGKLEECDGKYRIRIRPTTPPGGAGACES